ncbi:MAG TPA: YicC/YloC family endoribonuclease [Ignavibacteriaceae bacterium]|nr:YicC/YloC family endoribonuclease [Ignavibacteriaceae bacterium]
MISSMTGYGKGVAENDKFLVELEVKSVNSRYLDIYLKLPNSLMNREYEIREIIKNRVSRGKLSVILNLKNSVVSNGNISIDKDKLKAYLAVLKEIKKVSKITEKLKLEHLLFNRELFVPGDKEYDEEVFKLIRKALESALDGLLEMRRNEGKELAKDLKSRISLIDEKVAEIQKESGNSANSYFEKLKERVKTMVEDITAYSDRLELELALIADKSEITEECVRLRSHLKFFLESMEKDAEPGRKLNFLCQEMNREANTISAKTISTEITHNSVLIKEEIEKIREQIQNIE